VEWVKRLYGSVVAVDTSPFIYYIEKSAKYLAVIDPFFEALDRGHIQSVTSTLTLAETLVHPLRSGDTALVSQYYAILTGAQSVTMLPVSEAIAAKAAELRSSLGLRTPDAVQIATGITAGATAFLTNDERLASAKGINIIILDRC
jgi:predicted nucleic acid-binding protein